MNLPVVKGDLIRSIGAQMMQDKEYLASIEREFFEENPHLAQVCSNSLNTVDEIIEGEEQQLAAKTAAQTILLLMYQALKQQSICDELSQ